jgi:hypothetical protein
MHMLPQKVASEVSMGQMTSRMSIQEMLKAAAAGTASQLVVTDEAVRQIQGAADEPEKTASVAVDPNLPVEHISTNYIDKLANAVEYIVEVEKEAEIPQPGVETKLGPGQGPNDVGASQAEASSTNVDAGEQGQATSANQPPMTPATQTEEVQVGKANTGLETNDSMSHPEQPTDPIGNESVPAKAASADLFKKHGGLTIGFIKELAKSAKAKAAPEAAKTAADNVDPRLVEYLLSQTKHAEDAINPATISTPASITVDEPPPGASASEDGPKPAEPSDVVSQKSMVASNDAAQDYTKRQAKTDPKSDVNKLLKEPPLSAATDKTIQKNLTKGTETAKISEAVKTAATRALLSNLAKEAEEKKKAKEKASMGGFTAPQVAGAAQGPT